MSDSPQFVLDQEGLFFAARFERCNVRKDGDRSYPEIIVSLRKYDGSRFERSFGYDDVDNDSGAQTAIAVEVAQLVPGCQVACRLNQMVSRAKGSIWAKLTGVSVLEPVTSRPAGAGSVTPLTNPHGGPVPDGKGAQAQAS